MPVELNLSDHDESNNTIAHLLYAELELARARLRGEQEHSRRLAAALAYFRGAASLGLAGLQVVRTTDQGATDDINAVMVTLTRDLTAGDALLLPAAEPAE